MPFPSFTDPSSFIYQFHPIFILYISFRREFSRFEAETEDLSQFKFFLTVLEPVKFFNDRSATFLNFRILEDDVGGMKARKHQFIIIPIIQDVT